MKPIAAARLVIDLTFLVLLLCAHAYRITGDTAHEWIGISVCVVFIAHNAINWKWYKNIFKGTYTVRRGVMTTVNVLLALIMTTLIITGLLHSRTVLAFFRLPGGAAIRQIHTTAAYWGLLLIGVHVGLHWGMIMNIFRKMAGIRIIVRVFVLALVIFGVWSFFDRDMFPKLFLGFSFDYWPEERPVILFLGEMLSIIGVYVFITYYALKIPAWFHQQEKWSKT